MVIYYLLTSEISFAGFWSYVSRIPQYVFSLYVCFHFTLCLWDWPILLCNYSLFILIPVWYSILWTYHYSFMNSWEFSQFVLWKMCSVNVIWRIYWVYTKEELNCWVPCIHLFSVDGHFQRFSKEFGCINFYSVQKSMRVLVDLNFYFLFYYF